MGAPSGDSFERMSKLWAELAKAAMPSPAVLKLFDYQKLCKITFDNPAIKKATEISNLPAIKTASEISSLFQKNAAAIYENSHWRDALVSTDVQSFQRINQLFSLFYSQHLRLFEDQRIAFGKMRELWIRFSALDLIIAIGKSAEHRFNEFRIDDILIGFYWCIFDDDLRQRIDPKREYIKEEIDGIVIEYYSQNQYENIKKHVKYWQENGIITNRMPLINSALSLLDRQDDSDSYNAIIPLLLAQEDGLKTEIRNLIPDEIVKKIRLQHTVSKLTDELRLNGVSAKDAHKQALKNAQSTKLHKISDVKLIVAYLGSLSIQVARPNVYSGAKEILCRTFHSNWNDIEQLADKDKHNKFRDRILHGHPDSLEYGTKKNLVHSWLELILLVEIYILVKHIEDSRTYEG